MSCASSCGPAEAMPPSCVAPQRFSMPCSHPLYCWYQYTCLASLHAELLRSYIALLHGFKWTQHLHCTACCHQSDNRLLQIFLPNQHCSCTCCRCGVRPNPLSKPATPLQHRAPPRAPTGCGPAVHSAADAVGSGQDVGHRPPGGLH